MVRMAQFDIAYPLTSMHEGGYVNDPTDRGGETYAGITRKNFPTWPGWATVDAVKPKTKQIIPSLAAEVKEFYRVNFWNRHGLSGIMSQKIANAIYDWNVNSGAPAIKSIQRLAGVTDDGVLGMQSVKAINACNEQETLSKYIDDRIAFYKLIVEKDPKQKKFLTGWVNRAKSFAV